MNELNIFAEAIINLDKDKTVVGFSEKTFASIDTQEGKDLSFTEKELSAEIKRLEAEFDALAWERSRQAEYPSIEECVHAILDDDLDALQAKRAEIKTKYPKG